jgi:predicted Zn-dependent protease
VLVPDPYIQKAKTLMTFGALEKALELLNRAVELMPRTGALFHTRAETHLLLKQGEEARRDIARYEELQSSSPGPWLSQLGRIAQTVLGK